MNKETLQAIRFYWAATMAVALSIFFFIDLGLYFGKGEDYTLSATLRSVFAISPNSFYIGLAAFLCGCWFSHLFQFGGKVKGD